MVYVKITLILAKSMCGISSASSRTQWWIRPQYTWPCFRGGRMLVYFSIILLFLQYSHYWINYSYNKIVMLLYCNLVISPNSYFMMHLHDNFFIKKFIFMVFVLDIGHNCKRKIQRILITVCSLPPSGKVCYLPPPRYVKYALSLL